MACGNLTRATYDGVTELQRRNAELEARVIDLSQALRRIEAASRRTAGAAHDIRNALTVILGEADLLTSVVQTPEQLESVHTLTAAARIVASITQEMLVTARRSDWTAERRAEVRVAPTASPADLAEMSSSNVMPRDPPTHEALMPERLAADAGPGEVNTGELLMRCQKLVEGMLRQTVEHVFAPEVGLWPISVQPEQLEAALLNLVANARDAMPMGGLVRVAARNVPRGTPLPRGLPPGDYVGISVEDTGLGMAPEILAKATEAFFTTKSGDRGTGLGLAMVKAFATEGGGALDIRSEIGHGTRAEILLPRARPRPQPIGAADTRHAILERIRRRVRTPWLANVLDAWSHVAGPGGLPRPACLEPVLLDHSSCCLVLAVDRAVEPFELRLVRMGQRLIELLEQSAIEQIALNGPELFGTLATTYRRALRSRCPNYQYARHSFGRGEHVQFERLVLPAASDDQTVSHLFGIVLISTNDTKGEHEHGNEHREPNAGS